MFSLYAALNLLFNSVSHHPYLSWRPQRTLTPSTRGQHYSLSVYSSPLPAASGITIDPSPLGQTSPYCCPWCPTPGNVTQIHAVHTSTYPSTRPPELHEYKDLHAFDLELISSIVAVTLSPG